VISRLLGMNTDTAARLIEQYDDKTPVQSGRKKKHNAPTSIELPSTATLSSAHKDYLRARDFDPYPLIDTFDLKGTSWQGSYKWRILAPIYLNGHLVSYQGRDITDRSDLKYKACKMDEEVIHHKDIVYAGDLVKGRSVVICEGITDVWRLGPGAVCTFGTGFSAAQVRHIASKWDEAFLLFDAEEEAQSQADRLAHLLSSLRHDMQIECIELNEGDPGEMKQEDADSLMKDLIGRGEWK
jgi:DNA primase